MLQLHHMVSAVILTHNSAETLKTTLRSVSFCDEIVVIDDDSTDDTITIAERHKAKVYKRSLHEDFARQRNFGVSKARGEWVLFVDHDEEVSEALMHEIQHVTQKNAPSPSNDGYLVRRSDFFLGRWLTYGETRRVKLLRLAKKDAGRWERPVHEVWKVDGPVGSFVSPLLHRPHPTVAHFLDEVNWYTTVNAKHLFDRGVRVRWWEIAGYPLAKFLRNYLLLLGFLDGMPGTIHALMMSFHSYLTRAKLWQLWDKQSHPGHRLN